MRFIDRFHPGRRATLQSAIDAGRLRQVDEMALLEPEQIMPMARLSLRLFLYGGISFTVLNLISYVWHTGQHGASLNPGQVILWVVINVLSYVVMLPIHELIHGITIALLGGKPHYGTKLPFALYCGAKDQIFSRNYYLVIALAPLVLISLAGIVFTLLAPGFSSYVLLAVAGNISGAAGDLWVVRRLRTFPTSILVEDLETGYHAWEITAPDEQVTVTPVS